MGHTVGHRFHYSRGGNYLITQSMRSPSVLLLIAAVVAATDDDGDDDGDDDDSAIAVPLLRDVQHGPMRGRGGWAK